MTELRPVLSSREAASQIRNFVKDQHAEFLYLLCPLIPYIAGAHLLDALITDVYFPDSQHGFSLFGSLVSPYFLTVLIISWHRFVIHGSSHYVVMNPFSPKRHEIMFIIVGLMIVLVPMLCLFLIGFVVKAALGMSAVPFVVLPLAVAAIYGMYRCCLIFPALAVDAEVTPKQAFMLSDGYLLKIFCASFLAVWRIIILTVAYMVAAVGLMSILSPVLSLESAGNTISFIFMLPVIAYFDPLMTVFGVTVLSNYYMHAIQNRRVL